MEGVNERKISHCCNQLLKSILLFHSMITAGEVTAYLGLLNGMIGGTILVLPLLGMQSGYLATLFVAVFYGSISCYSCLLIIQHLGEATNIRDAILDHFNNKHYVTVIYNLVIGASLLGFVINYFSLLVIQAEGFFDPSPWIAFSIFILLIILTVIMRCFHFGEKLLALGILSIITYVGFLLWAHFSAPTGERVVPAVGPKYIDLAASLIMGYAIHDFVVQVLLNTTTHDKFRRVIIAVFVSGTIIYTFISFGGYAIINREPRVDDPETIEEYFPRGGWQVGIIEILYAFHLFTASPEFSIIMRIRFLQMFKIEDTPKITILELIVYICIYGICYGLYLMKIRLATIIEINGSVIGFLYVFLIPIVVHLKCVYFTKHDEDGVLIVEQENEEGEMVAVEGICKCKREKQSRLANIIQLIVQIAIIIIGICTVIYTMHNLFGKQEGPGDIKPDLQPNTADL